LTFWDRLLLCSLGWPLTHDLSASAFRGLGLQKYITINSFSWAFQECWGIFAFLSLKHWLIYCYLEILTLASFFVNFKFLQLVTDLGETLLL
jgi:hypothetical protein